MQLADIQTFRSNHEDAGLRHDILNYLPGDILVKSDRCAMACGLELRAPFLDKDFAEFCLQLPYSFKRLNGKSKRILRATMEDEWPDILKNRPKQGFSMSYENWQTDKNIENLWNELEFNGFSSFQDIGINTKSLMKLHFQAKEKWNLLCLGIWLKNLNDGVGL
jgi:asparagine synthase (glutamine-hydrolysing)